MRLSLSHINKDFIFIVFYSLSITAEGAGGPVFKALFRTILLVLLLFSGIKSTAFKRLHSNSLLYIVVISIPIVFSLLRGRISQDILQFMMYINCIIFAHLLYFKNNRIELSHILSITLPIIVLFFIQGILFNNSFFWRETYSDDAVRLGGRIINPNELGMLASVAIVCIVWTYRSRRNLVFLLLLVPSILVLIATQSRSSLIACCLGIFVLLNNVNKIKAIVLFLFGVIIAGNLLISFLPRSEMTSDLFTLTGRAITWQISFSELLPKYWLIGAGFQNFPGENLGIGAKMAHNTFIQQMIGGGLFSLFLGLYLVFRVWFSISKEFKACLTVVLINAFTEFGFFGLFNHSVFLFALIIMARENERNTFSPSIN